MKKIVFILCLIALPALAQPKPATAPAVVVVTQPLALAPYVVPAGITFALEFRDFDTVASEDGKTDVVKKINWKLIATKGTDSVDYIGTTDVTGPLVGLKSATEKWAADYVTGNTNISTVKEILARRLTATTEPTLVKKSPPFIKDKVK